MALSPIQDVLVIGAGPAGLTAALTVARQLHTTVVFDSGNYRNGRTKYMHTVPTWDHRDPAEFRASAKKDILSRYDTVKFQDTFIKAVKKTERGFFQATDASGKEWVGRKLVLASGVHDIYPNIEGYDDCWVTGIFHCLFCHGYEEKSSPRAGVLAVGDLAFPPPAMHLARSAAKLTGAVTIYTDGAEQLGKEFSEIIGSTPNFKVDTRKIKKLIKGSEEATVIIKFEDGSEQMEGFLAHRPKTALNGPFAEQLAVQLTETGDYKTEPPFWQTSVPGVFAAGDCSAPAKIVPNAIMTGALVGAGLAAQLQAEDQMAAAKTQS